jgi:hypothetical protein
LQLILSSRVLENSVLRGYLEVTGSWRKLRNEELCNLYSYEIVLG